MLAFMEKSPILPYNIGKLIPKCLVQQEMESSALYSRQLPLIKLCSHSRCKQPYAKHFQPISERVMFLPSMSSLNILNAYSSIERKERA